MAMNPPDGERSGRWRRMLDTSHEAPEPEASPLPGDELLAEGRSLVLLRHEP